MVPTPWYPSSTYPGHAVVGPLSFHAADGCRLGLIVRAILGGTPPRVWSNAPAGAAMAGFARRM